MVFGRTWGVRFAAVGALIAMLFVTSTAYADEPAPPPASVTDVNKSLEQMQAEAAAVQAEFARATIAYTNALHAAQVAEAAAKKAEQAAASSKGRAAVERRRLGQLTAQAYQSGIPTVLGAESMLWSLAPVAENLQDIADRQTAITRMGNNQVAQYKAAKATESAAGTAVADAAVKRAAADKAAANARRLSDQVRTEAANAARVMEGQAAQLAGAAKLSDQLQAARNEQALSRWKTYLAELAAAGVKAPPARELRNPARLPSGLKPLTAAGHPVRGVASTVDAGRTVPVLPAETIRAVNRAFALLGKPYGIAATGPDRYGCLGAARMVWEPYTSLPNLLGKVYRNYQKVPTASVQPGDLLVMGRGSIGLFHIGVAIGDGEMIAADEAKGSVVVSQVPDSLYAALRPTLGRPDTAQVAPASTKDAYAFRCGNTITSYSVGSNSWTWPLPDGTYRIGASFGQPGRLWVSGVHTGQDFVAAVGTRVRAVAAGTVRVEHPAWAGNLVRIDHGNGLETLYAHLSTVSVASGTKVSEGQRIGAVGVEGNSTGPHLHFEVRLGGDPVSPMPFLATGSASVGWGGYSNGLIPTSRLCTVASVHRLRCDAAAAYRSLSKAYRARFGRPLCITDSYRSYAAQVDLYARKPSLAALPGTSNHGWGIAVDLCGGIQSFGTAQYRWMTAHAGTYGWVHPAWARQGGNREEPWHWEFGKPPTA
jgi:murein DD-endopeptidase MepM/ murein hydrolase activator NlpD